MREAGELARATARGPFKRWTKGDDNSPVSEGDIAVNDLLQRAADRAGAGRRLAVGGNRSAARRHSVAGLGGGPDRRHPRLYHRARRLDHFGGAGGERPAGAGRALRAGDRRNVSRRARQRRRAQRRGHRGQCRGQPRWREIRRAETLSRQTHRHQSAHPGAAQGVLAGAATSRASRSAASMPPSPRPAATIGIWRRPISWCTKRAGCSQILPASRCATMHRMPRRAR